MHFLENIDSGRPKDFCSDIGIYTVNETVTYISMKIKKEITDIVLRKVDFEPWQYSWIFVRRPLCLSVLPSWRIISMTAATSDEGSSAR